MAYLNQVQLIGTVGNDPEVRTVQGGAKVASFRLATTERFKDRDGNRQEQTEWHQITVWNNKADFVEKFVHKGSNLFLEGKLRTRQWQDQQGNKRYSTEVVAENIQMLDKRSNNNIASAASSQANDDDLPWE